MSEESPVKRSCVKHPKPLSVRLEESSSRDEGLKPRATSKTLQRDRIDETKMGVSGYTSMRLRMDKSSFAYREDRPKDKGRLIFDFKAKLGGRDTKYLYFRNMGSTNIHIHWQKQHDFQLTDGIESPFNVDSSSFALFLCEDNLVQLGYRGFRMGFSREVWKVIIHPGSKEGEEASGSILLVVLNGFTISVISRPLLKTKLRKCLDRRTSMETAVHRINFILDDVIKTAEEYFSVFPDPKNFEWPKEMVFENSNPVFYYKPDALRELSLFCDPDEDLMEGLFEKIAKLLIMYDKEYEYHYEFMDDSDYEDREEDELSEDEEYGKKTNKEEEGDEEKENEKKKKGGDKKKSEDKDIGKYKDTVRRLCKGEFKYFYNDDSNYEYYYSDGDKDEEDVSNCYYDNESYGKYEKSDEESHEEISNIEECNKDEEEEEYNDEGEDKKKDDDDNNGDGDDEKDDNDSDEEKEFDYRDIGMSEEDEKYWKNEGKGMKKFTYVGYRDPKDDGIELDDMFKGKLKELEESEESEESKDSEETEESDKEDDDMFLPEKSIEEKRSGNKRFDKRIIRGKLDYSDEDEEEDDLEESDNFDESYKLEELEEPEKSIDELVKAVELKKEIELKKPKTPYRRDYGRVKGHVESKKQVKKKDESEEDKSYEDDEDESDDEGDEDDEVKDEVGYYDNIKYAYVFEYDSKVKSRKKDPEKYEYEYKYVCKDKYQYKKKRKLQEKRQKKRRPRLKHLVRSKQEIMKAYGSKLRMGGKENRRKEIPLETVRALTRKLMTPFELVPAEVGASSCTRYCMCYAILREALNSISAEARRLKILVLKMKEENHDLYIRAPNAFKTPRSMLMRYIIEEPKEKKKVARVQVSEAVRKAKIIVGTGRVSFGSVSIAGKGKISLAAVSFGGGIRQGNKEREEDLRRKLKLRAKVVKEGGQKGRSTKKSWRLFIKGNDYSMGDEDKADSEVQKWHNVYLMQRTKSDQEESTKCLLPVESLYRKTSGKLEPMTLSMLSDLSLLNNRPTMSATSVASDISEWSFSSEESSESQSSSSSEDSTDSEEFIKETDLTSISTSVPSKLLSASESSAVLLENMVMLERKMSSLSAETFHDFVSRNAPLVEVAKRKTKRVHPVNAGWPSWKPLKGSKAKRQQFRSLLSSFIYNSLCDAVDALVLYLSGVKPHFTLTSSRMPNLISWDKNNILYVSDESSNEETDSMSTPSFEGLDSEDIDSEAIYTDKLDKAGFRKKVVDKAKPNKIDLRYSKYGKVGSSDYESNEAEARDFHINEGNSKDVSDSAKHNFSASNTDYVETDKMAIDFSDVEFIETKFLKDFMQKNINAFNKGV